MHLGVRCRAREVACQLRVLVILAEAPPRFEFKLPTWWLTGGGHQIFSAIRHTCGTDIHANKALIF